MGPGSHKSTCTLLASRRYSDVTISVMASRTTSVSIVYSNVCAIADQRKHQSSASLTFVRGVHRSMMKSPFKRPVTRKISIGRCHHGMIRYKIDFPNTAMGIKKHYYVKYFITRVCLYMSPFHLTTAWSSATTSYLRFHVLDSLTPFYTSLDLFLNTNIIWFLFICKMDLKLIKRVLRGRGSISVKMCTSLVISFELDATKICNSTQTVLSPASNVWQYYLSLRNNIQWESDHWNQHRYGDKMSCN